MTEPAWSARSDSSRSSRVPLNVRVGGKKTSWFGSNPSGFYGMLRSDRGNKGEQKRGEVAPESLFTTSDKGGEIATVSKLSLNS